MNIWDFVGNTPMVQLSDKIYAKLETYNPTGSIKDRPISYIVNKAILSGEIKSGTTLVEATSGNTGISLSALGAKLGLNVLIIMPRNMSEERKRMMKSFGAKLEYVGDSDFKAAIDLRNEICKQDGFWSPKQFENQQNIECHESSTAVEIIDYANSKNLDFKNFVSGAGTGGTIMGVARACKKRSLDTSIHLVVPDEKIHNIQGIGDGSDYLVDRNLVSEVHVVTSEEATERAQRFAKQSGVLIGISAAANILVSERLEKRTASGNIFTVVCDRGERYLSYF